MGNEKDVFVIAPFFYGLVHAVSKDGDLGRQIEAKHLSVVDTLV
jgi:hypothetical protein